MNPTRAAAVLLGVLLWTVLPAGAESPVNFSGTWELDRSRSVLPSRASALPGDMTLVIDHNGETVKIERQIRLMGMRRSTSSIYYTDGRETSNVNARGDTVISRSRWEGVALLTTSKSTLTLDGKTQTVEATDVKKLAENGKVLVVDSTVHLSGQDAPERTHLVFVRK